MTTYNLKAIDHINIALDFYSVDAPKAAVVVVHGLGEYKKRYQHIARAFNDAGYSIYAYDLRGHGDSGGKKGHSPSYDYFLKDLKVVIQHIVKNETVPVVLYGHSMGGNIVTNYLINKADSQIKAAIITSPWFRLSMKASSIKLAIGQLALKLIPALSQNTNLNPDFLSHDKRVAKEYEQDPKVHQKITPGTFFGMRRAGLLALKNQHKIQVPVLISHGTADKITDHHATEEFAGGNNNLITLKLWPEMYHETHNEIDKEKVIKYNIEWLDQSLR